jgi:hypothetical protein
LITCGHLFSETAELKEMLLRAGVLMVWVPSRLIPEDVGRRLFHEIQETVNSLTPGQRPKTIKGLIDFTLENWKKTPADPDLNIFEADTWVQNEFKKNKAS